MKALYICLALVVSILTSLAQTVPMGPVYASVSPRPVNPDQVIANAMTKRLGYSIFDSSETVKMGLAMLKQKPEPIHSIRRNVNGINMVDKIDDSQIISIGRSSCGYGNARIFTDTVNVFSVDLGDRCVLNYVTLIMKSPGRHDDTGVFITLDFSF